MERVHAISCPGSALAAGAQCIGVISARCQPIMDLRKPGEGWEIAAAAIASDQWTYMTRNPQGFGGSAAYR